MSAPLSKAAPRYSLDISPTPLSIRTLTPRRGAAEARGDAVDRVRGEFREMRGFSPTIEQAARLFGLPHDECDRILGRLVQEGYLRRTDDGRYRLPPR